MLIALVLTVCPVLAFGYVIAFAVRSIRQAARRAAWRTLAAKVATEEAALATPLDERPVYHPVQFDRGLLDMMKRDGFDAQQV